MRDSRLCDFKKRRVHPSFGKFWIEFPGLHGFWRNLCDLARLNQQIVILRQGTVKWTPSVGHEGRAIKI